ncbi:MAG: SLC13/DASS family transporter [Akkermansia sp.]|nr:SLC13/DASS family transporter [Akkermansia sp.]
MLNTPEETLINPIQARVVALFIFAALMWILEVIPIWTTSVAVIALTLFATSNQSLNFLKEKRFEMKEVYSVIENVVTPEACPTAVKKFVEAPDPETPGAKILESPLAQIKADVKTKLTKKGQLTNDDLYMTVSSSYMNYADKCAKAASKLEKKENKTEADNQLMADYKAAADELYGASNGFNTSENRKALKDVKIVNLTQQKSIFATFADPIILLFLGGFFLADAATKYRLDVNLARVLLKPFGTNPKYVLLGLMTVTAVFSMFMSNTATAAMMLALLTPVLALFKPEDRGRAAFALCIPIGANVGGIGTPIGTPPNAIALKFMQDIGLDVSFGKWMAFGIPFVVVMLLVAWFVLLKMFPISQKSLDLSTELKGKFLKTPKAIIVYITFIVTILMWIIPKEYHGLDSNSVAIIPIAVFSITGVITKKDLKAMSWDVLWLVAGGFALGVALSETNLAKDMINAIPFGTWDSTILLIGASCICLFMATFMSHTATAALLVPILGGVASAMLAAGSMDSAGAVALLVTVAFASSLGMALPISTPPNAMAYATGHIEQKGMAISGTILCLLGLAITIVMMTLLGSAGFFG